MIWLIGGFVAVALIGALVGGVIAGGVREDLITGPCPMCGAEFERDPDWLVEARKRWPKIAPDSDETPEQFERRVKAALAREVS